MGKGVASVIRLGDTYKITWSYQKSDGSRRVHHFSGSGPERTLHNATILANHGYRLEPADIINALKEETIAIQKAFNNSVPQPQPWHPE